MKEWEMGSGKWEVTEIESQKLNLGAK